jgi:hypothetical protein
MSLPSNNVSLAKGLKFTWTLEIIRRLLESEMFQSTNSITPSNRPTIRAHLVFLSGISSPNMLFAKTALYLSLFIVSVITTPTPAPTHKNPSEVDSALFARGKVCVCPIALPVITSSRFLRYWDSIQSFSNSDTLRPSTI